MTRYTHCHGTRLNWLRTMTVATVESWLPDGATMEVDTPEWNRAVRANRAAAKRLGVTLAGNPRPLYDGYPSQYAPRNVVGVYDDTVDRFGMVTTR